MRTTERLRPCNEGRFLGATLSVDPLRLMWMRDADWRSGDMDDNGEPDAEWFGDASALSSSDDSERVSASGAARDGVFGCRGDVDGDKPELERATGIFGCCGDVVGDDTSDPVLERLSSTESALRNDGAPSERGVVSGLDVAMLVAVGSDGDDTSKSEQKPGALELDSPKSVNLAVRKSAVMSTFSVFKSLRAHEAT